MPLPKVKKRESESEFVSRCTGNDTMVKEFPDQKQRIGVCYSIYKQYKKKKSKASEEEEINWDGYVDEFFVENSIIILE